MDKDPGVTTGTLARRLGVAPTTLRSWDRRYGIGPAARAAGRHRRWSPGDVAVLEAMCRLTASGVPPAEAARAALAGPLPSDARTAPEPAAPDVLPLGDVRQECRGLARAAVRLDAPAVARRLTAAVESYGVVAAWEEVMAPVLHAVGRAWASSGEDYVAVEHLLSWHVSSALRRTGAPVAGPGPVLLACVPGEQHTLALEALHAALTERGVPARMFGAAVPEPALTAAVDRLGPSAVVLWAQSRATADPATARRVADARWGVRGARRGPSVVLGGPGWLGRVGAGMVWPGGLREALGVIRGPGRG
ncbi:MerR family transcriptional regulator [Streptomyces roseirectus]|uniref:MerR family transcriptional regulator n=1 Tax=Streptomyces roseirectus TaxID=2768066 RepID=A0A7H0I778_9ACTN|nr:MerR family transcriptional regulator [Streptomyces roseirectus]QNP68644.1 MerR family transcriptional regulator [Streptomyces roseirectus]